MQGSNQEQHLLGQAQYDSQDDSQTESSQNQDDGFNSGEAPGAMMPHPLSQSVDMHPVSAAAQKQQQSQKPLQQPHYQQLVANDATLANKPVFQIDTGTEAESGTSSQEISPSQIQLTMKAQNKKSLKGQQHAAAQQQSHDLDSPFVNAPMSPSKNNNFNPNAAGPRYSEPRLQHPDPSQGSDAAPQSQQLPPSKPLSAVEKCGTHGEEIILLCLKDSEKICAKCLHSTHLLHPVVPLGSLDQLDFQKSLKQEIETSLKEIQERQPVLNQSICSSLRKHKITLRNHIIFIRDNLREEFDDFFNNLLQSIRKDWNLFTVQEKLIKQTKRFNDVVSKSLNNITEQALMVEPKTDLKKFYEQLSDAQVQVQRHVEEWKAYEGSVQNLMGCLRQHSAFDVIDGDCLKGFMSENLVMNYSNIELNRVLMQQQQFEKEEDGRDGNQNGNGNNNGNNFNRYSNQNQAQGSNDNQRNNNRNNNNGARNQSPQQRNNNRNRGFVRSNNANNNNSGDNSNNIRHNFDANQANSGSGNNPGQPQQQQQRSSNQGDNNEYFRSSTSQLQQQSVDAGLGGRVSSMAQNASRSNSELVGHGQLMQRAISQVDSRSGFGPDNAGIRQTPNRIHYFKFDQRTIHYYLVDIEKKSRELLNIDFNIPIRFCSIQTSDGKIFITGGAKNSSQSSNHAYELRDNVLAQLPNMLNPREGHCLAAIGSNFIYAIGSRLYNTSKTCEVYSVARNQWREQPELNRNRYLSTAVTIQDRYIYVLGGYEPSVTDIERLDTDPSDAVPYWELIKVWSQSFENDIKYWFGACPVSQTEILIFGGKKDGHSSQSSYLFDTQLNQISKTGNMPNKDTFYQRTFLCKNGKVYAYGYENDSAYVYSIANQTWTKKIPSN